MGDVCMTCLPGGIFGGTGFAGTPFVVSFSVVNADVRLNGARKYGLASCSCSVTRRWKLASGVAHAAAGGSW